MIDDELEDDELDAQDSSEIDDEDVDLDAVDDLDGDDDEGDIDDIDDSVDDGSDVVVKGVRAQSKTSVSEDLPSLAAKQKDRDALAQAMEEFLSRGGKVQELADKIDV